MNITDSPSGRVIISPKGYNAFVPHKLPPQIQWEADLVSSLSRADFLLGMLAREGGRLPNPHLMIRPFVMREAVLSSKIEGTRTTLDEMLVAEANIDVKENRGDMAEVQNYINALNYGIKRLHDLPLSLRLLKEIHERLMQGVRGSHATPGEFRRSQNWIGIPGCTLSTAKFVPPPPDHLMDCLSDLETFLHDRQLPPLIHIALCHYQFEVIHPFLDGNGRIGRLLITLLLIEWKVLPSPLLYLSAFFEATRDQYYAHLYQVSAHGNWNEWLIYFLNGVAIQSEDALSRAERINMLLSSWRTMVASKSSSVPEDIVQCLAVNPYITANGIAQALGVAYSTAQRGIQKLEEFGIVTQKNAAKRDRMYCATEILKILEEPTRVDAESQI